ncbi:MAG TPA: HEAT repeat domain-containing protein [Kofleriaceae bacterium]|nr:HEAT repeat domain-containing protein [Kofleriaceae bacterium]
MRRLPLLLACALSALAPIAATSTTAHAQAGDWGVTRDPFDKTVIARYKGILAKNPHDAPALAKLLEMYRRYRTVDLLKEEYGKVLEKSAGDWSALVVLGRLARATGDDAKALEFLTKATGAKESDALAWMLIGELQKGAAKNKEARAAYDKALAHASGVEMKKKALRALADLALTTGDNDGANAYFKQFLDLDPKNAQLWIERGDAMLAAGKRDVALESYTAAEKLLGTDKAKQVEVVARRGQALEGMGKDDEAIAEYRRAIKLSPKGYYLEVELTGRVIDIYRRKQALPALLAQYEKEWPEGSRKHFEWNTLGKLYEETGSQDKAIAALKKAVVSAPTELETQRRLIQLLENSGRDDEALAANEAVVRAAPGDARFQLELAERYWKRGEDKKALETLSRLQTRFPNDPGVLSAIADFYMRWGKDDLAIGEYERLAKLEPDDPAHLVTLGEQYFLKGDKKRAMEVWKRLKANNKATGWAKFGEVMVEHNFPTDALDAFNKAIELDGKNPEFFKGRASLFESQKRYPDAIADWQKVLDLTGTKPSDRLARRDATRHQVQLITRSGVTKEREFLAKWNKGFVDKNPPDVESGYFLVEYYSRKNMAPEQRATLEKMRTLVPEDWDLLLDLVKSYRQARKFDEAVALLLELAKKQPARELQVYQEISEIKTEARKDDEAIEWAQKALAKSPTNAAAYERLGERYVEMQRFPDAIDAYEKTVKLDARNSKAAFALAQLYIQTGTPMKATELFRNVLRNDTNDDVIARAGDQAIDLEEMTDTLGELEKVISPLSFMMAHKPVYRRVLVKLYLRYVPRLVERSRHGNDEVKKAARVELDRIGARGLRPLLEALRDQKDVNQQRIAVQVLGHLGNKGAAQPLVHMARQEPPKDQRHIGTLPESPDREARVDALVAAGRLGDAGVLDDVLPLMDHPESSMREAATFTLGRSGDRKAVPALIKALGDRQARVQALACLGLAQIDDARVGPAVIGVLKDANAVDQVRGACAYAIGARKITAGVPALIATLDDNRGDAQRLSAWALGQLAEAKALGPLARAYFARAGQSSDELVWAIGRVSGAGLAPSPLANTGDYPMRAGNYNLAEAIREVPGDLPHPAPAAKLVVDHATDIAQGLTLALGEHRDVVVSVLADLDAAPDRLALGALTPATNDAKVTAALATIAATIEPQVVTQLTSEDPKVRALAVSVLAKMDGGKLTKAEGAIGKALTDPAEQVRASAMQSIAVLAKRRGTAPSGLVASLAKTLEAGAWADRRVAALSLGAIGPSTDPAPLIKAAKDPSSFVREAVAVALGKVGGAKAQAALDELAKDEVPQVRDAATAALGNRPKH